LRAARGSEQGGHGKWLVEHGILLKKRDGADRRLNLLRSTA